MTETKKYKILIIDDDKLLLDVYSIKFKKLGHKVVMAPGGEEALEKIKEEGFFDAIIVDVVMPGMDGFEFLSHLREQKLAEDSVVVVLTNQGETKDIERAKTFNVEGYIVKASTIPSDVLTEVLGLIEENKKQ